MPRTHYEALGVPRTASAEEIRKAYRQLVLKYHPDRSQDPKSLERFLEIKGAYEVLSDWERRRSYDKVLALEAQKPQTPPPKAGPSGRTGGTKHPPRHEARSVRSHLLVEEVTKLAMLHSRGQSVQAEKLAHKILAIDDRQPIPYAVLGDLARSRGDLKEAAAQYARAVQMDPKNPLYLQRHEELLGGPIQAVSRSAQHEASRQTTTMLVALGLVLMACIYLVLSKEQPLLHRLKPVSTWTLGVWAMAFVCGSIVGAALSVAELVDRFLSIATTSLGKVSPIIALATIAIVNYWAALAIYLALGVLQGGFNYSTTRVLTATAAVTILLSIAAAFSPGINGWQVLLWSGNVSYMGALCGWMVADSLRR